VPGRAGAPTGRVYAPGLKMFGPCFAKGRAYPYGMGKPRDHKDAAQDITRELADIAGQLASLKGEANSWLRDPTTTR
jgi:hypothetical protein